MAQFLFIYRRSLDQRLSPAQLQEAIPKWQAWFKELAEQGHLKDRGNPLEHGGMVVRGSKKGGSKNGTTDGPYAEKDLVTKLAKSVRGVDSVDNNIMVRN